MVGEEGRREERRQGVVGGKEVGAHLLGVGSPKRRDSQ